MHARKVGKKEVLRETSRIAGEKIESLKCDMCSDGLMMGRCDLQDV